MGIKILNVGVVHPPHLGCIAQSVLKSVKFGIRMIKMVLDTDLDDLLTLITFIQLSINELIDPNTV